jgi:NAD(P) transhydrogenase subunit alpha
MLDDPAVALTILVHSLFVGVEVISKVPPLLHTPLMSGSNAISGITIVGALLAVAADGPVLSTALGFLAVVCATINVIGGFLVTNRMLGMFKQRRRDAP